MNRAMILGSLLTATVASVLFNQQNSPTASYQPRSTSRNAAIPEAQFDHLSRVRVNLNTGRVERGDRERMALAVADFNRSKRQGGAKMADYSWQEMGPDNVGGRVRAICVDPANTQKIWTGGVSGGLWLSLDGANTWQRVESFRDNLMVSSIAILGNGHLYVATGCEHENPNASNSSGFVGDGLFMSADDGSSFTRVLNPADQWQSGQPGEDWAKINRIKADPNNPNRVYIASSNPGARIYDESDGTVSSVLPSPATNASCIDVEVCDDGSTVLWSVGVGDAWIGRRNEDQSFTWSKLSGTSDGVGFPQNSLGRLELAIARDNSQYMYALAAGTAGQMSGAWSSTDNGHNWFRIWPHNIATQPNPVPELDIFRDNRQGWYDNAIAVRPGHPDEVWLGGVEIWKTSLNGAPQQLALADAEPGCFFCVHADVHEITFVDANTCYVGCDGGVFKTPNGGFNFYACNRDLAITQFYDIAVNSQGQLLGGAQDNGTQLIDGNGTTAGQADLVSGGDGFAVEMSQMDTNIMFACIYGGDIFRSNDGGNNFGSFYDSNVPVDPNATLGAGLGDFNTNFRYFEDPKDENCPWTVKKLVHIPEGQTLLPGESIPVGFRGNIGSVTQYGYYTNTGTEPLVGPWTSPDSIEFQDKVTSIFAAGFTGTQGVWVTRHASSYTVGVPNDFNGTPVWARVTTAGQGSGGTTSAMAWSADGNTLFWGTYEGDVYAVSGFNNAYSRAQLWADSTATCVLTPRRTVLNGSTVITNLAPDPSNPNRLVVTIGGYGGAQKVRLTENADQANPTFTNIWNVPGELTGMPCYSAVIHKDDGNTIAVGTEFGVWITDDAGASWTNQTMGMQGVPVFSMRQQTWNWENNPIGPDWITNPNVIYAGTHGRGIFKSEALVGIRPVDDGSMNVTNLLVYPNPAVTQSIVSFELAKAESVRLNMYDMDGKLVRNISRRNMPAGKQNVTVNVADLRAGTYIVEMMVGESRRTARLLVSR